MTIYSTMTIQEFQSTHPRGVRPSLFAKDLLTGLFQSTHPRGVRLFTAGLVLGLTAISIHAPTRGATKMWQSPLVVLKGFQSTHPRGVRLDESSIGAYTSCISIHAPTRGATLPKVKFFKHFGHFNPRTHEGCDSIEGELKKYASHFNPRTHEGCD